MSNILEDPENGSISRPVHITPHTWEEETKQIEDSIRDSRAFEGKWQSFVDMYKLVVPEELRPLIASGGVLTVSTEYHLLLFGSIHWNRMQRILAKDVGLSPVNNEVARHIYSHMYRFNSINEDGTIHIPIELAQYAGIKKDVAIIGMIYHAEIHDKQSYMTSESPDNRMSMLERFKQMRFNK